MLVRIFRSLGRAQDGATALAFGVTATVVIGFAGVAVEGGSWYVQRRSAQTAADTAAFAGAMAVSAQAAALGAARETSARNGFTDAIDDTLVTVNHPPISGAATGDMTAVEVVVRRQIPLQLAALFIQGATEVTARSVARAEILPGGAACVLTLGNGSPQQVSMSFGGNGLVSASSCSLVSNSSISQTGSSSVRAFTMRSVGSISVSSPENVVLDRPASAQQPATVDPFAAGTPGTGIPLPASTGTCNSTGQSVGSNANVALAPGRYCSSGNSPALDIKGTARLSPGVYYLQNGDLDIGAQANVTCPTCTPGNGVTFVFTGSSASIGGPQVNGGATVNLVGGTAGYTGVLMYQDPRISSAGSYTLNGGGNINTAGLFYFPKSNLTMNGNFGGSSTSCKAFTSASLTITGTADLYVDAQGCATLGVDPATQLPQIRIVRLSE
ncbi:putative Flp pilus-assembly TadE/G-like protein [Stella humosa]|uniref:Putative Flp pilus-assembly TadE/G-like protein n=2 Tax=Stella humosa TaxID=94 RepID=A0A3N1M0X6_9PROT|nr:putative Flp pilus-assembly TadE/G-like protein [Stella humosa]